MGFNEERRLSESNFQLSITSRRYFTHADVEPQIVKLQPPVSNLLFLGDYVDRGEYGLEVVALLVSLKLLFRDKVTLLRGDHEIMEVNREYVVCVACLTLSTFPVPFQIQLQR